MVCRKDIKGKILWDDHDNIDDTRPSFVEVVLLRNNQIYRTIIVSVLESEYTFGCVPVYNEKQEEYIYTIDELQTPEGYTKTVDKYNIVNSIITFELSYVFNNIVHNDYDGKIYTEEKYTYPIIKEITIKGHHEVFPEYTDECEFIGWNTMSNGSGTYFYPNDSFRFSGNSTLYAIWRSCQPHVDPVYTTNSRVRGSGVIGIGNRYSIIQVVFSTQYQVNTYTTSNNSWYVAIPPAIYPLSRGSNITIYQREQGKQRSDEVIITVE